MTRIFLFLTVALRTIYQITAAEGLLATRLGENCNYDDQCQQRDSNSQCAFSNHQQHQFISICTCKVGYRGEIINNTERCVVDDLPEEEKEGLTAAPIILCFMGCVIVEAFCLLAFRYWKKHRRAAFPRHHTLHLEAFPVANTRIPQRAQRQLVSFMITSQVDSSIAGTGANSPPPYSQTAVTEDVSTQAEDPPPTYEEAIKQCMGAHSLSTAELTEGQPKRKMSF